MSGGALLGQKGTSSGSVPAVLGSVPAVLIDPTTGKMLFVLF